jgi:UDP:flavonoid glycosyltransferase YjiC (YdhE family)
LDFELPNEMLQNDKLKFIGGMAAINNNSNGNQQNPDEKVQFSVEELAAIEQAKQGKGLIIVSFGTVVETDKTPDQIFNILFNAFKQFSDYVFLWRFEDTTGKQQAAIDQHNNDNQKHIYTSKWLKQTALLGLLLF